MPVFPKPKTIATREQAINAILLSIAMEETALSHLINAESEKIHYVVECARKKDCRPCDLQKILEVNESAASLIEMISDMQIILKHKMSNALRYLPQPHPPTPPCPPPHPPVPPHPPKPPCPPKPPVPPPPPPIPCTKIFSVESAYLWRHSKNLFFNDTCGCSCSSMCDNGVKVSNLYCDSRIILPPCGEFEVALDLQLDNPKGCHVSAEIILRSGSKLISTEVISCRKKEQHVRLLHKAIYGGCKEVSIAIKLVTPEKIRITQGTLSATLINPCGC